jgi:ABC-type amino acid transport substrate-binding protein
MPFGFRDPSGNIVGFEPDLAKDVADRLGDGISIDVMKGEVICITGPSGSALVPTTRMPRCHG